MPPATRDNLGYLLAKSLAAMERTTTGRLRRGRFPEVKASYGSVLISLLEHHHDGPPVNATASSNADPIQLTDAPPVSTSFSRHASSNPPPNAVRVESRRLGSGRAQRVDGDGGCSRSSCEQRLEHSNDRTRNDKASRGGSQHVDGHVVDRTRGRGGLRDHLE